MSPPISTELFRTFYGVGLYLSFSKAAKAAGISQSAVSQSIKQLERELDMVLFERTTKSVAFTQEGQALFDTVAHAFSVLDDGVLQLQQRVRHDVDAVKLAASDTLCRNFLLPYLQKWQQEYPQHGLQIMNRPSPQCVEAVRDGQMQIAIVNIYDELLLDRQMEVTPLVTLHDIFAGGSKYKRKRRYSVEEIMQEPMLLLEYGSASRIFFDNLLAGHHKRPDFELGSLEVLIDLLRMNMGVSLVPREFITRDLESGELVELRTAIDVPTRQIGLVRSRLTPLSESASYFVDMLTK